MRVWPWGRPPHFRFCDQARRDCPSIAELWTFGRVGYVLRVMCLVGVAGGIGTLGVPMSRYGYDYALMPSRPTGWRSVFSNVLMVGAIVAVAAVRGGVGARELRGSPTSAASAPAITASAVAPASARAARVVT